MLSDCIRLLAEACLLYGPQSIVLTPIIFYRYGRVHAVSVDVVGKRHVCNHGSLREDRMGFRGDIAAGCILSRDTICCAHSCLDPTHSPVTAPVQLEITRLAKCGGNIIDVAGFLRDFSSAIINCHEFELHRTVVHRRVDAGVGRGAARSC